MQKKTSKHTFPLESIQNRILLIRGHKVMLDSDLAALYRVPTKRLNEQVKRNRDRFPADLMFQLTPEEKAEVVANCDHLRNLKYSPTLPYAFTEYGAFMLANVLNSTQAITMSLYIIRAFVRLREVLAANQILLLIPPRSIDAIGFEIGPPRPGKIG